MKILGIETSCDETSASIVANGTKILSEATYSSFKIHVKTGGIIPENAARQQIKSIIPVISKTLKNKEFDAIAVTVGPGLIGSLLVGVETAKTLSYLFDKPIIPINHLVAHIYSNYLNKAKLPSFPLLCLIASGGHSDLVLMKNHGKIKQLGSTRDDAAGEAFDKTARLLKLPYPGGPSISKEAERYEGYKNNILNLFPRPMINEDNFDFSFSGLKTAVLKEVNKNKITQKKQVKYSAEIQEAIVDVLIFKTMKAFKRYKPKSLLLAGGVSANKRLREKLVEQFDRNNLNSRLFLPNPKYSTDNASAVASCAFFNKKVRPWNQINVNPELTIIDKV